MERRKFTREFKLEAVRLIRERGVSYTSAATDCLSRTKYLELPEPRMPLSPLSKALLLAGMN
jgi:hypothetical protein